MSEQSWWLTCKTREEFYKEANNEKRLARLKSDKSFATVGWGPDDHPVTTRYPLRARQDGMADHAAKGNRAAAAERASRGIRDAGLL